MDIDNKIWESVRVSIRDSVWFLVWDSVRFPVEDSIQDSVGNKLDSYKF